MVRDAIHLEHNCGFKGKVNPITDKDLNKIYVCPACVKRAVVRRVIPQPIKFTIKIR